MILGVGIDICSVEDLREALDRPGRPLIVRAFTPEEIELAGKAPDEATFYAGRFAAKEAVLKALGVGLSGFDLRDMGIVPGPLGRPEVIISGDLARSFQGMGGKGISLSISHDGDHAVAVSVLEG